MAKRGQEGVPAPFKIMRVQVIEQHGVDLVRIETDLPFAVFPYSGYPQNLTLEVSKGMGIQYVRENFNMEPEVIKL